MTVAVIAAMQNGKSVADLPEEGYEDMVDVAVKFRRDHGPHRVQLRILPRNTTTR